MIVDLDLVRERMSGEELRGKIRRRQGVLLWWCKKENEYRFIKRGLQDRDAHSVTHWCTLYLDDGRDNSVAGVMTIEDLLTWMRDRIRMGDSFHWFRTPEEAASYISSKVEEKAHHESA